YFICALAAPEMELLYQVDSNVAHVIRIHIRLMWSTPMRGSGENVITESYVDRSFTHKKLSPRNSNKLGKKKKNAMVNGICRSIGIHPPNGFTPACLYSLRYSCCNSVGLSCPTFSLISSISGLSTRILAMDTYDRYVRGESTDFNSTVRIRITNP